MESHSAYQHLKLQADQAREKRDFELAFKLYSQAYELMPDRPEALKNLGRAYTDLGVGNERQAEFYYRKAIDIDPTYWQVFNNLGIILKNRAEWDEAIAMLEKAIALCPESSTGWRNLGNLYCDMGNYKKAQYYYNKSLIIEPGCWSTQYNQACCFEEMGNYKRALRLLSKKLIDKTPEYWRPEVYAVIAKCHYGLGDYEKSIQVRYQVMSQVKPERYYYQYQQIAMCYQALKQPDLAYEACLKACENHTKEADGFDYLKVFVESVLQLRDDPSVRKMGIQYLLENAFSNPESDIAHYYCALAFNCCGDFEKAVTHAKKAIALSHHPRNYFQLANAYWGQRDAVACLKVLKKMLSVDPLDCYEAQKAMAFVYRQQGKEKLAVKLESRLESLKAHRDNLSTAPHLIRDGEIRYSLFVNY